MLSCTSTRLIKVGIKRVNSSRCLFIFARADFPRSPRKAARFALIFPVPHIPIMILRNRQPLICVSIASSFFAPQRAPQRVIIRRWKSRRTIKQVFGLFLLFFPRIVSLNSRRTATLDAKLFPVQIVARNWFGLKQDYKNGSDTSSEWESYFVQNELFKLSWIKKNFNPLFFLISLRTYWI